MADPARPPTVAVFGGNHVPSAMASPVARAVVEVGGVVLTGGDGKHHGGIKGQALVAANDAAGDWIGVPNGHSPPPTASRSGRGLVLRPEIGDRRNLFEAWLCDAAIVFEGGLGTVSECVSALCLGRPVLLLGRTWVEKSTEYVGLPALFTLARPPARQRKILVEHTRTKLGAGLDGPMSAQVDEVIRLDRLVADPSLCRHVEGPEEALDLVEDWVVTAVEDRLGHFPSGAGLDALERPYRDWWGR